MAEYLILRVKEMDVTGGDNGLIKLLTEAHYAPVELTKLLLVFCSGVFPLQHKAVVADRLNLKIVVKLRKTAQLKPASVVCYKAEYLARFTCRTDYKPLPVLHKQTFRHDWIPSEILQMALCNDFIQIFYACLVFYKDDYVFRFKAAQ